MKHAISNAAHDYLEFIGWVQAHAPVTFTRKGRRHVVAGDPVSVTRVTAAGKAVDAWLRADAAAQRRHAHALATAEGKSSDALARELARLARSKRRAA